MYLSDSELSFLDKEELFQNFIESVKVNFALLLFDNHFSVNFHLVSFAEWDFEIFAEFSKIVLYQGIM